MNEENRDTPLTDREIEELGFEAARRGESLDDWSLADDERAPFERGWRRAQLRVVN